MTFQEFLATKRALAIVEHMETLSEDDARELFESLDDATVELIEQLLDENLQKHPMTGKIMPGGFTRKTYKELEKDNPKAVGAHLPGGAFSLTQMRERRQKNAASHAKSDLAMAKNTGEIENMDPRKVRSLERKANR